MPRANRIVLFRADLHHGSLPVDIWLPGSFFNRSSKDPLFSSLSFFAKSRIYLFALPSLHPFSISAECDLGSKLLRVKIRASRMSYVHHTVIA